MFGRGARLSPYMGSVVTARPPIHINARRRRPGFPARARCGPAVSSSLPARLIAAGSALAPGTLPPLSPLLPRLRRGATLARHESHVPRLPPAAEAAAEGALPLPGAGLPALPVLLGLLPPRLAQRQPQLGGDAAGPRRGRAAPVRGARRGGPSPAAARRRGGGGGRPPGGRGGAGPGHGPLAEAEEGQHSPDRPKHPPLQPARGRGQGLFPER